MAIDSKLIAKNTMYMYIRQIIVMVVTLYTARVILDKLGAEDYGIFNAVAGVVGMLSFLNNTLAKGTSRFLTFELGRNNEKKLNETFSTAFISHLALALFVVVLLVAIGPWFISHKMMIPDGRMHAALWCFNISLTTTFFGIIMVPFSSSIISHEDMNVYAYLGLFEAAAKLIIAYLITFTSFDRLIFYSCMIAGVQLLVFLFYMFFCKRKYAEANATLEFKKEIFKDMIGFSGWNLVTHFAQMISVQGRSVLISMFFMPVVVAAIAIANQVTTTLMNFVNNFTTALNPQIIKTYAEGEYQSSKKLTLEATVFVFDLVLLICLPFIFTIDSILNFWLVEVPEYATKFCQFILVNQVIGVFSITFFTPMLASGKLKTNSIWAVSMEVIKFVVLFILFKMGMDVMWLMYIALLSTAIWSFLIKPSILIKQIGYDWESIKTCYLSCMKVLVPAVGLSLLLNMVTGEGIVQQIMLFLGVALIVIGCSIAFMKASLRQKLKCLILIKIKR